MLYILLIDVAVVHKNFNLTIELNLTVLSYYISLIIMHFRCCMNERISTGYLLHVSYYINVLVL